VIRVPFGVPVDLVDLLVGELGQSELKITLALRAFGAVSGLAGLDLARQLDHASSRRVVSMNQGRDQQRIKHEEHHHR
jgi:hypothetical protein